MERRDFLIGAGMAAGGVLLGGCARDEETAASAARASMPDGFWGDVRRQFSLEPDVIHMSALLLASNPTPVREAIARYRHELDANPARYVEAENNTRKAGAREAAAEYLGGDADYIALTDSTTMGIAIVYHGLPLREGQEVLTTQHDYYATHEALRQVSDRTGASIRKIALYEDVEEVSADEIVSRIAAAITSRTRAVALTWVHSGTGLKLPLREISQALAEVNTDRDADERVLLCVDGVHGLGVEDERATDFGCDFFMAGCHKWLFGPRGTGIVWARPESWAALIPTIPSFIDDASWSAWARGEDPAGPTTAARMSPGGFKPFEHQWAVTEAFRFHLEIGKERIATRTHALARRLKEGLAELPHVRLITPMSDELSAGIVCFAVDGLSPEGVVERLRDRNIIASVTPYADPLPRLTPSIYNAPEEVDAVIEAVATLR